MKFSKLKAQIYLALLGTEPLSAYQLAKRIEISRTSIYNALEHMLEKGMVEMAPGETADQENALIGADEEGERILSKLKKEKIGKRQIYCDLKDVQERNLDAVDLEKGVEDSDLEDAYNKDFMEYAPVEAMKRAEIFAAQKL